MDVDFLESFLADNSFSIDEGYIQFLLNCNGGNVFYAKNDASLTYEWKGKKVNDKFYRFFPFQKNHPLVCQPSIWKMGNLRRPKTIFEVAVFDSGRNLCFDFGSNGENSAKLFIADMESRKWDKMVDIGVMYERGDAVHVANGFENFIQKVDVNRR